MLTDTDKKRYQCQADVVQSLAHPLRLALVDHLQHGECCVQDLAEHVGSERSNVSRHLAVLLNSGIVASRKQGVQVFYTLRTPCILNFLTCATSVLRQSIEEGAELLQ